MLNILFALKGGFNSGGTEAVVLNIYNNIDKNQYHIDFMVHDMDTHDNPIHESLFSILVVLACSILVILCFCFLCFASILKS